ncbi:MAG: fibronectin type III domain-containing protein [Candidatus Omnitrophica bacterium]|nr:fibronectin type III domain-containing protein [Candidatus Omnitrophota bacterium]
MRAAGANRLIRWGVLAALLGWGVPVMAADTLCDPSLTGTDLGGNWVPRWGTSNNTSVEPALHLGCAGNGQSAIITTSPNNSAVILSWLKGTPGTAMRKTEASFMVPSLTNWSHFAAHAAYRPPLSTDDPDKPSYAFGRIGADAFHEVFPDGAANDRLVIQFDNMVDNAGQPMTCEGTNLHAWMPIPDGLQVNHWYRINAQIVQRADSGLDVVGTLQDLERGGLIIASTMYSAPATCTPVWYGAPENRWLVGVLGFAPNIDTYIDDFVGWPEQTPPIISAISVTNITATTAKINWTTHEPATSQVDYGLTTSYGSMTPVDATLMKSHAVTLANLQRNRLYYYRVRSIDAVGNASMSGRKAFRTSP